MVKPKVRPEPLVVPGDDDHSLGTTTKLANGTILPFNDASSPSNDIMSPSDVRSKNNSNSSPKEPSPSSLVRRRTSSQSLPPLVIQHHFQDVGADHADGTNSSSFFRDQNNVGANFKEVQDEGVYLYHENFLKPEISRRGLEEPDSLQQAYYANVPFASPTVSTPCGYKNPKWAKVGKEIRIIADEFTKSKERAKITKKANKYSESAIQSYQQFYDLLSELFQGGGVTIERLVVLFFFCSDITIIALEHNHMHYFGRLVAWTFRYIRERLSELIAVYGGWDAIMNTTRMYVDILFKVAVIAVCCTFIYSWSRRR